MSNDDRTRVRGRPPDDLHTRRSSCSAFRPRRAKSHGDPRAFARIKMGRFRWAMFFPFPGTAGYRIATDMKLIDFEKMIRSATTSTARASSSGRDGSPLREGGQVFNWWVNAGPTGRARRSIGSSSTRSWRWTGRRSRKRSASLQERDRELSDDLLAKGIPHYTIRYSHVMGVHSDFVLWERGQIMAGAAKNETTYTLD